MDRVPFARALVLLGAVLCIPGAIVAAIFVSGVAEVNTLEAAPGCVAPTRDPSSTCLSVFRATITAVTPHHKTLDHVTIAIGDSSFDLGYACNESPREACDSFTIQPGTPVVTGWWKGQLVAFGPAEGQPTVVTELNPYDGLRFRAFLLFLVIPGISVVVAGLLVWQAPMYVGDLIKTAIAKWPDPPRPVDRPLIWRVAWGNWTWGAWLGWLAVDFFASAAGPTFGMDYRETPVILVATFIVMLPIFAVISPLILTDIVCNSYRTSIVVQRIKSLQTKGGPVPKVWYQRPNGKEGTKTLEASWNGLVREGDHLDTLTDKAGSIVWLLSTPPPSGVGREAPSGGGLDQAPVTQTK